MKSIVSFVRTLTKRYTAHEVAARSAQMTYYWILAFFPFLIMILTILSYTNIAQVQMMNYLADYMPSSVMPFIESTIEQFISYRSPAILSAGAAVAIWSASAAVNGMIRGIHTAYNSKDLRSFFIRKGIAVLYTLLLIILIAGMIVLLVFGNKIGELFLKFVAFNDIAYKVLWDTLRLTTPLVGIFVGIFIIYKFVPRKHVKNSSVLPGTLFTTLGWYGFSLLFSIYIDHFSKYNQMYGSIGGVFILLIWLYATCMILLLGAEINALYQERKIYRLSKRRQESHLLQHKK